MAIMGALKVVMHTQCHVTPYGRLHCQKWESQEAQWELAIPVERPTQLDAPTRE